MLEVLDISTNLVLEIVIFSLGGQIAVFISLVFDGLGGFARIFLFDFVEVRRLKLVEVAVTERVVNLTRVADLLSFSRLGQLRIVSRYIIDHL